MEKVKVVVIRRFADDAIVKEINCHSESQSNAEKVQRGVSVNLNHSGYYTKIEDRQKGAV